MMIKEEEDLLVELGCSSKDEAKNTIYKYTDCGAWLKFLSWGVQLGSIVEGSEAEVGPYSLKYPFDYSEFEDTIQDIENETDELWTEANYE